jgi:ribose transport system permease protein
MSNDAEPMTTAVHQADEIAPAPIESEPGATGLSSSRPQPGGPSRLRSWLAFKNIGAVYIWILVVIVFSIWVPHVFISVQTIDDILTNNAITALTALALIVPLSAGVYDLSIGYALGLTAILVAKLVAHGTSPLLAVIIAVIAALAIGLTNGVVVVVMKIDSFIGTLASGAVLSALVLLVSEQPIAAPQLLRGFSNIAGAKVAGVNLPVIYALVLTIILWYLLEHTPTGRNIYATGYGRETARLSGIRTERLRFGSLMVSALLAGLAGIVVTSQVTSGDPTIGPEYLLPAFAAAFVGATQLRHGRFNPWGTIIAVVLLGTGIEGLADVNAPAWAPNLFTGVVLILAVGLTGLQRRRTRNASS